MEQSNNMADGNGHGESRKERFKQGVRLLHQGRAAEAEAILQELYDENPNDTEVALNLGGAYILQQRHEEALPILERAAQDAPHNENIWVNLAAAHLGPLETSEEAQQERAIRAYEQALAANPDAPNVHYMLGLVYRSRKDNMRAAAHFTRALEQDPKDNDARRMLAAIAADVVEQSKNQSGDGREG
jgi:tetratricopeptide (TPR) repeat protein